MVWTLGIQSMEISLIMSIAGGIDDQSITTQKLLIDCYRLVQKPRWDGTKLVQQFRPSLLNAKNNTPLHARPTRPSMPFRVINYVYGRSLGGGFTEYNGASSTATIFTFLRRMSVKCLLLTRTGENALTCLMKTLNHRGQLGYLQSELVDPLWSIHANISV